MAEATVKRVVEKNMMVEVGCELAECKWMLGCWTAKSDPVIYT